MADMADVVLTEVVLELLQRAPAGLGTEPPDEHEGACVDQGEQPERQSRSERSDEQWETNEMMVLVVHRTNTAAPMAKPRIVIGKISESSNQINVPMKVCTKNTTISIPSRIR